MVFDDLFYSFEQLFDKMFNLKNVENKSCLESLETCFYIVYSTKNNYAYYLLVAFFLFWGDIYFNLFWGGCGPYILTSFGEGVLF